MSQTFGTFLGYSCSVCRDVVEIKEGTVLYDTRWYHQKCWDVSGGKHGKSNSG